MYVASIVILASAAVPLAVAWQANRNTTLRHALAWAGLAWMSWLAFGFWPGMLTAYASLTLTCCAGLAVFGARRPGLVAWDFIVASLLVILWLGWAEGLIAGTELKLGTVRLTFLTILLATVVLNYLLTSSRAAAMCLALASAFILSDMFATEFRNVNLAILSVGTAPWYAWLELKVCPGHRTFADRQWLAFRDRFGVVWAMRVREQFNCVAKNAGWSVRLGWSGFRSETDEIPSEWVDALVALYKRFTVHR